MELVLTDGSPCRSDLVSDYRAGPCHQCEESTWSSPSLSRDPMMLTLAAIMAE